MTDIAGKLRFISDFGGIDASHDKVLLAAFEDHNSYNWALDLSKPFIIGRKGSGKSAVYQKITREPKENSRSIGFTFADYPWQHHSKQKQIGVPEEECYRESWKYFICLMFCKLLLSTRESIPQESEAQEALSTIESFIIDSYGTITPNLSQIFTPGKQIKVTGRLNIFGIGGDVGTIDVEHLPKFYSEINQNIIDCILLCLPKHLKYYICFDELDIGFEGSIYLTKQAFDRMLTVKERCHVQTHTGNHRSSSSPAWCGRRARKRNSLCNIRFRERRSSSCRDGHARTRKAVPAY